MKAKEITYVSCIIALIIILGLFPPIYVGFLPVPIIIQNAGIMLSGLLLGGKRGGLATLLFLLLVALGLPILAGGRGGIGCFFNSTSGYLLAYPIVAFLAGWLTDKMNYSNHRLIATLIITCVTGVFLLNIIGILGIYVTSELSLKECFIGGLIFIPGDVCKAIIVALIAHRIGKIKFM